MYVYTSVSMLSILYPRWIERVWIGWNLLRRGTSRRHCLRWKDAVSGALSAEVVVLWVNILLEAATAATGRATTVGGLSGRAVTTSPVKSPRPSFATSTRGEEKKIKEEGGVKKQNRKKVMMKKKTRPVYNTACSHRNVFPPHSSFLSSSVRTGIRE